MKLVKNAITCKHCGTTVESKFRHDFSSHSCKGMADNQMIAADGGLDYLRRVGNKGDWFEASEWEDDD